jgi:hypothetical protein
MFHFCIPSEKNQWNHLKSKCFALGQYISAAVAGRERYAACFMCLRLGKWATRLVLTI